jgi:4-amino-4-deoxy-L-arabinose transferase-like glycosyltransferase
MKKLLPLLLAVALALIIGIFFSYRIWETPPGLTIDEASIGYNAVLISKTLRDETGRLLPVFPLTIGGRDWKQPSSVYATAVMFKLFGASIYNLRLVSILTAMISLMLVVLLNYLLLGKKGAWISCALFLTAPVVLMHSHLAQENIMPIPFVTTWLIGILLFKKGKGLKYIILSGFLLGMGIYSYKGMRAIVPSLTIVTVMYLFLTENWKSSSKSLLSHLVPLLYFCLGMLPFVLFMPWINTHYAGALFDTQSFHLQKYYDFLYPYISSFDISALFIKGDSTVWHSTGLHGVFLISTIPLFIIGLVSAYRQKTLDRFWIFLLAGFFISPLLYGQVGSVYRFSRLLVLVPFFVSFCTLGFIALLKVNRGNLIVSVMSLFIVINFTDFIRYYWYEYPKYSEAYFLPTNTVSDAYQYLSKIARKNILTPYIAFGAFSADGQTGNFLEAAYFDAPLKTWLPGEPLPAKSIVMAKLEHQDKLKTIGPIIYEYRFFVNEGENIIELW